jgi:hypothetical protein
VSQFDFVSVLRILNFSATNWYGVDFVPSAIPHKWRAQIQDEGEEFTIGFFQSKIQAGLAVNRFCAEQGLPLQIPLLQNVTIVVGLVCVAVSVFLGTLVAPFFRQNHSAERTKVF